MRFYGFDANEIVSGEDRNLSLDIDPKLAWALANRHFFPVDVNRASREELLRIPGIGVRNVKRILQIRKYKGLQNRRLKETASRVESGKGVRYHSGSQSCTRRLGQA